MKLADAIVGKHNPELNRHMAEIEGYYFRISDYTSDRNAVARVEYGLTPYECKMVELVLKRLVYKSTTDADWSDEQGGGVNTMIWHAPPMLRCIAVLQVKKPEVFTK